MSSLGRGPPSSSNNARYNDYDYYDSYDYLRKNSSSGNRPPKKQPFYSSRRDFVLKSSGLPLLQSGDASRRFSRGAGAYGSYGSDRSSSGGYYHADRYGYGNKPWRSSSGGYGSSPGSSSLINSTSTQQNGPGPVDQHEYMDGSRGVQSQSSMSSGPQQLPNSMATTSLYKKERYDSYTGTTSAGAPHPRYNGPSKERVERERADRGDRSRPQEWKNSADSYYPHSRNSSTSSLGFKERERPRDRDRDRDRDWYRARSGPFSFDSQPVYDEYDYLKRDFSSYPNGDKDEFSYSYNNTDGEDENGLKPEKSEPRASEELEAVEIEKEEKRKDDEDLKGDQTRDIEYSTVDTAEDEAKELKEVKSAVETHQEIKSGSDSASKVYSASEDPSIDPIGEEIVVKPETKELPSGECVFPLNRIETQYLQLLKDFESIRVNKEHTDQKVAEKSEETSEKLSFKDYSFFHRNIEHYFSKNQNLLIAQLAEKYNTIQKKRITLWKRSEIGYKEWDKKCADMTQQLEVLHPEDDEMKKELASIDIREKLETKNGIAPEESLPIQTGGLPTASRRNRRHGDLVTTEAEFQEILKSLEKQLADDPLIRARHVSAKIPEMILDPVKRSMIPYMDSNNYVADRTAWSRRIFTDFDDNFSQEEHDLFCEGYCLNPKKFGAISRHMGGLRTPEECVVHYYVSKKGVNYKHLLAQFKKKASKKNLKKKTGKSRNTSLSTTPVSTPAVENVGHDSVSEIDVEMQAKHLEDYFPDAGKRKRTAASPLEADEKDSKKKAKKKEETLLESPVSFRNPEPAAEIVVERSGEPVEIKGVPESIPHISSTATAVTPVVVKNEPAKRHITSYWTALEISRFPSLLAEYGMDWNLIAKSLETKTNTMVRNYYQRNADKFEPKPNSVTNGSLPMEPLKAEADKKNQAKQGSFVGRSNQDSGKLSAIMNPTTNDDLGTILLNNPGPKIPETFVSSHRLTSINSLLSSEELTNTEIKDANGSSHQQRAPSLPQKSSIMSLLNSDSSPVKPPATENIGSRSTPHISSLTALLNSSESPSGNGLSNLLSASHAPDNVS